MKAIVQERYGGPEVLALKEIDVPQPGPGEVRVKVHAAGVDMGAWHMMTGTPWMIRLGTGLTGPNPKKPLGMEVAGVVDAVGSKVSGLKAGDAVYGVCGGAFAEYAIAKPDKLGPVPANVTFEQAAAAPTSGTTALQALRDKGNLRPGQRVLVIGAGGGVGSFAVQLAKASGAEVTGVCSTGKADFVRSLGAGEVIDYTKEDFADRNPKYDLIIDIAGLRSLSHLRRALTPKGTVVLVGGEGGGGIAGGALKRNLQAATISPFTGQRLVGLISFADTSLLNDLKEIIEAGGLTPAVDRVYSLAEATAALTRLQQGKAQGKIVLSVQPLDNPSEG
jgi:NADPH:quinone reductase-like Zn-dependent oxidoreductase